MAVDGHRCRRLDNGAAGIAIIPTDDQGDSMGDARASPLCSESRDGSGLLSHGRTPSLRAGDANREAFAPATLVAEAACDSRAGPRNARRHDQYMAKHHTGKAEFGDPASRFDAAMQPIDA